jgi:nitrite reductase/ring-hydroxylating ferredoxin subunit
VPVDLPAAVDEGTAYGRGPGTFDEQLARVGAGTPMGELLRRYWQPVGLSGDATAVPRRVRVLGEDLILFRDGRGRPGLLHPRCTHRGTTLYYGKVEDDGIRCCYHGWLFDVRGRCLDQPCEPGGGLHRDRVRQPWYPVREHHGLVFAYLGPPERKPVFRTFDVLTDLDDGELVVADDTGVGTGGAAVVPCNWLQHYENVMDPFHVPVLHGSFSGGQFVADMVVVPEVVWSDTAHGVMSTQDRVLESGRRFRRRTEVVLPNVRVVPDPRVSAYGRGQLVGWVVPIDDTSFRLYNLGRVRDAGALAAQRSTFEGRAWHELTEAEHQRLPGDYEAQVGQGPVTLHSEEHLTATDRGVSRLRRLLRRQLAAVAAGGDPLGVRRDVDGAGDDVVATGASNHLLGHDQPEEPA